MGSGKDDVEHGHADAALNFVLQERPAGAFPFLFAMNLLHSCEDREEQLAVMRRAFAAWQQTREREFLNLFRAHSKLLPDSEALSTLHAVVESTLSEPEWALQGSFDEGRLLFTSGREFTLFEVLHILRHLDPSLAEELIAAHEQLAVGARRYPNGWESIQKEAEEEQRRRQLEGGAACRGCGHVVTGSSQDIEFQYALQDGEFDRAMEHAQESYREDTDPEAPNFAPKVLWPSAARFRNVLYHAGRRLGFEAEGLLTLVPDRDLQLLANLEFAAAVAGLPEMPSISLRQNKAQHRWHGGKIRRHPQESGLAMVVDGAQVRCPGCQWRPRTGTIWGCRCGHVWNTFTTRGRCPACSYQWTVTQCKQCEKMFPHEDWCGGTER